jgi:hypothetical protein
MEIGTKVFDVRIRFVSGDLAGITQDTEITFPEGMEWRADEWAETINDKAADYESEYIVVNVRDRETHKFVYINQEVNTFTYTN